jgi:hypothetical protein
MTMLLWTVLFAAGLPYADSFVRRLTLLFPLLVAVTYLFGKFWEVRQFDAFIPVIIAVALSRVRHYADLTAPSQTVYATSSA